MSAFEGGKGITGETERPSRIAINLSEQLYGSSEIHDARKLNAVFLQAIRGDSILSSLFESGELPDLTDFSIPLNNLFGTILFDSGTVREYTEEQLSSADILVNGNRLAELPRQLILNKNSFPLVLSHLIKNRKNNETVFAIELDVRRFKYLNNHPELKRIYGDIVAQLMTRVFLEVATEVRSQHSDLKIQVGRTGGDEFTYAICVPRAKEAQVREAINDKVQAKIAQLELKFYNEDGTVISFDDDNQPIISKDNSYTPAAVKFSDQEQKSSMSVPVGETEWEGNYHLMVEVSGNVANLRDFSQIRKQKEYFDALSRYQERRDNLIREFTDLKSEGEFKSKIAKLMLSNPVIHNIIRPFYEKELQRDQGRNLPITKSLVNKLLPLMFSGACGTFVGSMPFFNSMIENRKIRRFVVVSNKAKVANHESQFKGEQVIINGLKWRLIKGFYPDQAAAAENTWKNIKSEQLSDSKKQLESDTDDISIFKELMQHEVYELIPEDYRSFIGIVKNGADFIIYVDNERYLKWLKPLGKETAKPESEKLKEAFNRMGSIDQTAMLMGDNIVFYESAGTLVERDKLKNYDNQKLRDDIDLVDQKWYESMVKTLSNCNQKELDYFLSCLYKYDQHIQPRTMSILPNSLDTHRSIIRQNHLPPLQVQTMLANLAGNFDMVWNNRAEKNLTELLAGLKDLLRDLNGLTVVGNSKNKKSTLLQFLITELEEYKKHSLI